MSEIEPRIEISESTITKMVSTMTALVPIVLGFFQYVNDPSNLVGVLICVVLFISMVLWRMTQQQLREMKAAYIQLKQELKDTTSRHTRYAQVMTNTVMMMMGQINRLSGDRDAGNTVLDPETGATVYIPPVNIVQSPHSRRATDFANGPHTAPDSP